MNPVIKQALDAANKEIRALRTLVELGPSVADHLTFLIGMDGEEPTPGGNLAPIERVASGEVHVAIDDARLHQVSTALHKKRGWPKGRPRGKRRASVRK